MKKLQIILLSIVLIFSSAAVAFGKERTYEQTLRELNQLTDTVLVYIKEQKFIEAKQLLQHISEQFLLIPNEQSKLTMFELQLITTAYDRAYSAVQAVSMSDEERLARAMEFRFVLDVLENAKEPLWKQTKPLLMEHFNALKKATYKQSTSEQQFALNQLLRTFEMIRPALMLSKNDESFVKLASQMKFLERVRNEWPPSLHFLNVLDELEQSLLSVFQSNIKENNDWSLFIVICSIGGAIIVALTYAGWKKYKGENRRIRERELE